jgi:hypothetical protein
LKVFLGKEKVNPKEPRVVVFFIYSIDIYLIWHGDALLYARAGVRTPVTPIRDLEKGEF